MRPAAAGLIVVGCLVFSALVADIDRDSANQTFGSMRLVPGATFRMGSDADELPGIQEAVGLRYIEPLLPEVPALDATVADFYMDVFDVTNGEFARFVAAVPQWGKEDADTSLHNGRYLEHWKTGSPNRELLDHPVTFITWHAAVAYCEWAGKRLPTEAEYEWASQDPGRPSLYPWGNAPPDDERVSWGGNGINGTVPVGSYPPNAPGLYDMSGNVWHFTADPWFGAYGDVPADAEEVRRSAEDPRIRRVVRGGSWGANAANLRIRYRDSHRPYDARGMVGFRCAKDADE